MAAGLGFKTFNTGDVLSATDVNGYLMQGILVFASATARDAAITAPAEGQFAYLKDTNVTTYYTGSAWANVDTTGMTNPMTTTGDTIYSSSGSTPARLGIGTAGQVLQVNSGATAPEWASLAAGAYENYSLLNAGGTVLTGATTITVSGITGINKLLVMVNGASSVNSASYIGLRINGDTGSNYLYSGGVAVPASTYGSTVFQPLSALTDSSISVSRMASNAASTITASISIDGGLSTGWKSANVLSGCGAGGGDSGWNNSVQGIYKGSAVISSISLVSSTGNFDAGTLYVYGSAN
jgi:hypothetical protein